VIFLLVFQKDKSKKSVCQNFLEQNV